MRKHVQAGTNLDEQRKVPQNVLNELGEVGYWGLLVDKQYGGAGAPFASFASFLTKMAIIDPTVAGLASVHGCIGAVDPVRTFGNAEQKQRFLPELASGRRLSAFALTEPGAGSDLTALKTVAVKDGDEYVVNGEKLFITNVVPGRTIGLVCLIDKRPAVLIVDLPAEENDQFQLRKYGLYALKHTYNQGIIFKDLRVPAENLLKPQRGDGLTIAYHGLNLGRISLCANAAGTMRLMMASMIPWAKYRKTYGAAISTRELVQRRLGSSGRTDRGLRRAGAMGRRPDRRRLPWRDGMRHRQNLRQRSPEGSRDRIAHEDARRAFVPARPHLRRQRTRVPGPVHLRRRRRNARHGLLQVAGQASRHAVLRAGGQGLASLGHQEAEPGQPDAPVGAPQGVRSVCQVAGRRNAATQAAAEPAQHARDPAKVTPNSPARNCRVLRTKSRTRR